MRGLPPLCALLLLAVACGQSPTSSTVPQGTGANVPAPVEILGTVAHGAAPGDKLLVFAHLSGSEGMPEVVSVAAVGPDRSFVLSNLPSGSIKVVFLLDSANDGAIDPGDPIAVLEDPEQRLSGLQPGERVLVTNVALDVAGGKAAAAAIEVQGRPSPATDSTATPQQ